MYRLALCAIIALGLSSTAFARSNYRGYSGAPGTAGTCAASCHGPNNGTVQISGFPTSYVPDSTYLITITAVSGQSINNFNCSVRRGTGSVNAGTITGGTNSSTYNVAGETNGVHWSTNNHTTGTFNWQAPAAGIGNVTLYCGAHQGTSENGANTSIEISATEAVIETPPGLATNPVPADGAEGVDVMNTLLRWTAADRADSYEIFIGITEPTLSIGTTTNTEITVPSALNFGSPYVWRVDATNEFGTTTGTIWHFTTESDLPQLPEQASNPAPADNAINVPVTLSVLSWTAAVYAEDYEIFFGQTEPLEFFGTSADTLIALSTELAYDTTYMWRVDPRNMSGSTTGTVWSFRTEHSSATDPTLIPTSFTLSQAYPNPFNNNVRVSLSIPNESITTAQVFDQTGRLVTTLLDNVRLNGNVELDWNAAGHSAGAYFLRCECNTVTQVRKLIYLP